ncbi:MAG: hypothetical protein HY901_32640 [Deltaproteobacteria bacterium]|nr:hypothetical protein [Deltaproteobacteria bacterium]
MRSLRYLVLAAFAAAVASGCTRDLNVNGPPVVSAGPDLILAARDSVILGATAQGSSPIKRYDWTVVSSPAAAGSQVSIAPVTGLGDVAQLTTGSLLGLYVVAVTATDADDQVSLPDFVNLTLKASSQVEDVEIVCESCRTLLLDLLELDEAVTTRFTAVPSGFSPTSYRWSATFARDPGDRLTGEPSLVENGASADLTLPAVGIPPAILSVTVVASGPNGDRVGTLDVLVANSVDEPPDLSVTWHAADAQPGDAVTVLPGDALYVDAVASDPNGDAVTCEFRPNEEGSPFLVQPTSDPCRVVVYPRTSGRIPFEVKARTSGDGQVADFSMEFYVAPIRVSAGGGALDAVDIARGDVVATNGTGSYLVFDASAPVLDPVVVEATWSGSSAAAFSNATALVGFSTTPDFARFDVVGGSELEDLLWPPPGASAATKTVAMTQGSAGRVFMAMDHGLAVYDPMINTVDPIFEWPGAGLVPSALSWGPSPASSADSGYVWYAEGNVVYLQKSEALSSWGADNKGVLVGSVQAPRITALSFGSGTSDELWDLWVGTGPSGAQDVGSLLLHRNAVDRASGDPRMNVPEELFPQIQGGISSLAVERDGAYAGDVWAVSGGGKLLRVSRAIRDMKTGQRGVVALELDVLEANAKAVATSGRRVAVATEQGLAVVP